MTVKRKYKFVITQWSGHCIVMLSWIVKLWGLSVYNIDQKGKLIPKLGSVTQDKTRHWMSNKLGLIQTKGYNLRELLYEGVWFNNHELPDWTRDKHQGDQLGDLHRRRGYRHCRAGGWNFQINAISCQVIISSWYGVRCSPDYVDMHTNKFPAFGTNVFTTQVW